MNDTHKYRNKISNMRCYFVYFYSRILRKRIIKTVKIPDAAMRYYTAKHMVIFGQDKVYKLEKVTTARYIKVKALNKLGLVTLI